jgi:4-amino-4-deoxy-L-arabinose transferase-like glycosyltransferase
MPSADWVHQPIGTDSMSSRLRHYVGLCLLAGASLGVNLGGPKLWDRDEPRNAGCAAEMLQRGDWTVPVFNGELRSH